MALARVQYTQQTVGNKNFTVPFPYISRDHIFVSVNGTDVDFSWLNSTTVQLTTAPAEGDLVDIRRETERVNLLVDFQDASTITEEQLDLSAKQAFFISQEAFDATGGTLAVANDGSYSANGRRITNLGDPLNAKDAVHREWVMDQYTSGRDAYQERLLAEQARDAAQASQNAAASSEANALSYRNTANSHRIAAANAADAAAASEAAAKASEIAAKASEDDVASNAAAAQTARNEAQGFRNESQTFRNTAVSSANSATNSAHDAGQSMAKAALWAEAPEDSAVELGKYSAKHHATKAEASSASAATSATNAMNYRDAANNHRIAASNSAGEAAASANAAANSASEAQGQADRAESEADRAMGYAGALNMPNTTGQAGGRLRVKPTEDGYELAPVEWSEVENKPSTFPPSGHNHDSSYVKKSGDTMTGALGLPSSTSITGVTNGLQITNGSNGTCIIGNRNASYTHYQSSNDHHYFYGQVTSQNNITAYSDKRVKTNFEVIGNALKKVGELSGYTYDRTDIETARQMGVIAQEVVKVAPEVVHEDPETGHLHVAYGNLVALLIEAIKELRAEVNELKEKLNGTT